MAVSTRQALLQALSAAGGSRDDCMRRYAEGGSPAAIFREAGLDPKIIGYKRVERCIARWQAENAEKAAQEQEAQE